MIKRLTWQRGVFDELVAKNENIHIERMDDDCLFIEVGEVSYDAIITGPFWRKRITLIPQTNGSAADWVDGVVDDRIPF